MEGAVELGKTPHVQTKVIVRRIRGGYGFWRDTYIGLGDLHRKKMESRWKGVKPCPSCKASFGQMVLEILGAADA